jgi:hypothetical protein
MAAPPRYAVHHFASTASPAELEARRIQNEKETELDRIAAQKAEEERQLEKRATMEREIAERRETERRAAPRRYAANLTGVGNASVYYFDVLGDFQELGKERVRRQDDQDPKPAMKRVKRTVDRWVYGPNDKYDLADGESELVTKTVTVEVPVW